MYSKMQAGLLTFNNIAVVFVQCGPVWSNTSEDVAEFILQKVINII